MRHILVRTDLTPSQPSPQAGRERSLLGRGLLLSVFLFVALVALLSVAAVAGENVWTSNGPYGGFIQALVIDPTNTQTVYAGAHGGGVFKSTNGGSSWTAINSGLPDTSVYSLVIAPSSPQTVYAGTNGGGVFKSTNGGSSWTAINSGLPQTTFVWSLAIDPSSPQTVYAGTLGRGVFEIRFPTILRGVSPDFDGDGSVDFNDFFLFAAAFGKKRSDAGLDAKFELDGDGEVGFSDFFIFAEAFGKQVR